MVEPDLKRILVLFTHWLATEDILPRITEQECADLGKAFLAGFTLGQADLLATTASPRTAQRAADGAAARDRPAGAA